MSKLNLDQGRDIRFRHSRGESIGSLVRAYGLTRPSIKAILRMQSHAYRLEMSVPDAMWDALASQAEHEGRSVPDVVRSILAERIGI
jgi:hypothetical protein